MINVKNYFDSVPETLQNDQKRFEEELLTEKKARKSCWSRKEVKPILVEYYLNKCAFCESKLELPESIDHYRPKAKEKYFWLAHEWTNFLPACRLCQKAKDNLFETENEPQLVPPLLENNQLNYDLCRADSAYLLSEIPLLLHPVLDNPKEHLFFDFQDYKNAGLLKAKTKRGESTIRICNLNRADLFKIKRMPIIQEKLTKLKNNKQKFQARGVAENDAKILAGKLLAQELLPLKQSNSEYAFVYECLYEYFS